METSPHVKEEGSYKDSLTLLTVIMVICLLLRGMSYLRIFSNLRYLINMIMEILKDMSSFLILLVYWMFGFTLVFYIVMISKQKVAVEGDDQMSTF
jgi:hypothetical protein